VVISADALWEKGLGVIFPELDGEDAFNDAAAVLDVIEALQPRWVIPGHGAPFTDVAGALVRARARLAGFSADPPRHLRHAMKVLLKYHLLEEQQQTWPELVRWLDGASLYHTVWQRLNRPAGTLDAFARQMVGELAASKVLAERDGVIFNV
jgi:glyoxylase-like metal-dependent hydrolase (beta-lactamase superfamily II)